VSTLVQDCYFECGASDTGPAAETITGAAQAVFRDTTFISTATLLTAQPHSALKVTNAITDMDIDTCAFSGGSTGWSNQHAINIAGAVTRLRAFKVDLLADSDATIVTGTTGYFNVRYRTGSARVIWAA
jgi:hypothetical protein